MPFIKEFNTYKMDFSDVKIVARKIHEFCKYDINAFGFITLYLVHCTNEQLNENPGELFEVVERLKNILVELSEEYPPGASGDMRPQIKPPIKVSSLKPVSYPMIEFRGKNVKDKMNEMI